MPCFFGAVRHGGCRRGIGIQNATTRRVSIQIFQFLISYFIIHTSSFAVAASSIRIEATATGLSPGEPLEFLLIGPESSHDYEAFAQCDQSAAEIRAAMIQAGMVPGRPADPDAFIFRPRGERLRITVTTSNSTNSIPLDSMLTSSGTVPAPPFPGFVFSGSTAGKTTSALLADVQEPYSIISIYNEAASIIDVRGTAPQQSVYGTRTLTEAATFKKGTPLIFTIEPLNSGGGIGHPWRISVGTNGFSLTGSRFHRMPGVPATNFVSLMQRMATNEKEVFLSIKWASNLTIHAAIQAAAIIQEASSPGWVIVDPPPTNTLYYRAFLPDPQHRDRARRIEQPWELHISTNLEAAGATLIRLDEVWPADADVATLTAHETIVTSGAELERALAEHKGLPVILVYAHPDTTIGGIMRFLSPCLDTHSTIYVFEERPL